MAKRPENAITSIKEDIKHHLGEFKSLTKENIQEVAEQQTESIKCLGKSLKKGTKRQEVAVEQQEVIQHANENEILKSMGEMIQQVEKW